MTALLIQNQDSLVQQLADAGDKPVVVAFATMKCTKFASMYSQVVAASPSTMVFLLVLADTGAAAQAIVDANGPGAPPSFLFFQNSVKVTSFSDPEAQKVVDSLQEKLTEC